MKVLSIGMDRKLLEDNSPALNLHRKYSEKVEEFHIIVFSLKKHALNSKSINNLHIYPTNSSSRISFLFDAYRMGLKILTECGFKKGDVITTQDPMTIVAYFLSKKTGLPFQMQIHTDIFAKGFSSSLLTWKNFWYSGWTQVILDKFLIKRADGIRVVSSAVRDSIIKKYPKTESKIDILPIFVDIEKLVNTYPKRDITKDFPQFSFIILMASRLTKEKRIDIAIKAMVDILEAFPRTGLVVCGSGNEKSSLLSLAKKFRIQKSVIFAGWQDDLVSYYKTASLFLLTSQYEGYGMSLIEAGASGCPIVTTRVGIAKTNLFQNQKNVSICDNLNSECVAKEVMDIMRDNQKREIYRTNMRDSLKSMSGDVDVYVKNYISLLEKIIK